MRPVVTIEGSLPCLTERDETGPWGRTRGVLRVYAALRDREPLPLRRGRLLTSAGHAFDPRAHATQRTVTRTADAAGTGTLKVMPVRVRVYAGFGLQAPVALTPDSPKVTPVVDVNEGPRK